MGQTKRVASFSGGLKMDATVAERLKELQEETATTVSSTSKMVQRLSGVQVELVPEGALLDLDELGVLDALELGGDFSEDEDGEETGEVEGLEGLEVAPVVEEGYLAEYTSTEEQQSYLTSGEESKKSSFEGIEDIDQILNGLKFTRTFREVPIRSLVLSEFDKRARFETKKGLTASIADMGAVLTPIDVMELPAEDGDDEELFSLISGLRRVYGATRNGYQTVPAFVWEFADAESASRLVPLLGLVINKVQAHSYEEIWNSLPTLEHDFNLKFSQIERLYPNLESGDILKLKEVCSEADAYEEPKTCLFNGEWSLDKAYKALVKWRKEQDNLEMEDNEGILSKTELGKEAVVSDEVVSSEETDGVSEDGETRKLSEQEVDELLEMADTSMGSTSLEDAFEQADAIDKGHVQDRKGDGDDDLTPEQKNKIKIRDQMVCQCCSKGKLENQGAFLSQLVVHHKVPVHAGGTDDEKNLITLCIGCHHLLHTMEKMGTLVTDKEHLDAMDEEFKRRVTNAWALAYVAIKAGEKKGYSRKERAKHAQESLGHKFPGQDIKNDLALRSALQN